LNTHPMIYVSLLQGAICRLKNRRRL
jgi:hypothetical protein